MRAFTKTRSLFWSLGALLSGALLSTAMMLAVGRAAAQSPATIPALDTPVVDLTDTLSAQDRQRLEARARELRTRSGAQLQILIVPTTAPEDVADYAQRVFDTQGLGRKGVDDGLLIVVAKNDRRMRIHVGTGLEAKIPDATAKRLIDEYLTPKFRRGDFAGGLDDVTLVLASLMNGQPLPDRSGFLEFEVSVPLAWFSLALATLMASLAEWKGKRLPRSKASALTIAIVGAAGGLIAMSFMTAFVCAILASAAYFLVALSIDAVALARAGDGSASPTKPSPRWNPDELTYDPNDPEVVRRRLERERREREAARNDDDSGWGGGWSSGGGGGSRGGGASGGW